MRPGPRGVIVTARCACEERSVVPADDAILGVRRRLSVPVDDSILSEPVLEINDERLSWLEHDTARAIDLTDTENRRRSRVFKVPRRRTACG